MQMLVKANNRAHFPFHQQLKVEEKSDKKFGMFHEILIIKLINSPDFIADNTFKIILAF